MLLKTISRSNAFPTKILIIFDRNRKINPKIHMETQKTKNRQSNLEQKEKCWPTTISNLIMIHSLSDKIHIVQDWKQTQTNVTEHSEIILYSCVHLIFHNGVKT
jgi:hypothetical protein